MTSFSLCSEKITAKIRPLEVNGANISLNILISFLCSSAVERVAVNH